MEQLAADALPLVLLNVIGRNQLLPVQGQQLYCSLLRVCKRWQAAIRQSDFGLRVSLINKPVVWRHVGANAGVQLASFATWLVEHPCVARSIDIGSRIWDVLEPAVMEPWAVMLQHSLQLAAHTATQQQATFSLACFKSHIMSKGLLLALPASSLTELQLTRPNCYVASITRLSQLRCLHMDMQGCGGIPKLVLQQLAGLQQLTVLKLYGSKHDLAVQHLPVQLQELHLSYDNCGESANAPAPLISMQQLTRLQRLHIISEQPAPGTVLPTQLSALTLQAMGMSSYPFVPAYGITVLAQLRQLCLIVRCRDRTYVDNMSHGLDQLTGLGHLQVLELSEVNSHSLLQTTSVWQQLRNLQKLRFSETVLLERQLQQLARGLARATSLTALELCVKVQLDDLEAHDDDDTPVCKYLTSLVNLRELHCWYGAGGVDFNIHSSTAAAGGSHLANLTALTMLVVEQNIDQDWGLPLLREVDVCLLAVKLTNLVCLCVGNPLVKDYGLVCMPALGQLTRLTNLRLDGMPFELAIEGVQYLTRIQGLVFSNLGSTPLRELIPHDYYSQSP